MKKTILPAMATLVIGIAVGLALNSPRPANSDTTVAGQANSGQEGTLSPATRAEIETIIRDYILANPEIIPEAIDILQDRMTSATIRENADALLRDPESPVAGNTDGDVTIVEFFDYACGFCKAMMPRRQRALRNDGNIRLVLKEFPILSEASVTAARAALAAHRQDLYMPFHVALMEAPGRLSDDKIFDIAGEVGLDLDRLRRDMDHPDITDAIDRNRDLARTIGVSGTPAMVIGDSLSSGAISYDALMELVAKARTNPD